MGGAFNLLDQLVFYGSYHNNPINQLIHIVFVPCIWFTGAVWLTYLPLGIADGINGSHALFLVYSLYYLTLGKLAVTGSFVGVLAALTVLANRWHDADPAGAWKTATGLHIVSWYMQIHPGHGIFEGRKPALLDSFVQSLVLAPLFVWFEVMFHLGFESKLRAEVQRRVDANIAEYKRKK